MNVRSQSLWSGHWETQDVEHGSERKDNEGAVVAVRHDSTCRNCRKAHGELSKYTEGVRDVPAYFHGEIQTTAAMNPIAEITAVFHKKFVIA